MSDYRDLQALSYQGSDLYADSLVHERVELLAKLGCMKVGNADELVAMRDTLK